MSEVTIHSLKKIENVGIEHLRKLRLLQEEFERARESLNGMG